MTQENAIRGEMLCTVGDQDFHLVPTFKRIARLEAALGKSVVSMAAQLATGQGITITEITLIIDIMSRDPKPDRDGIGQIVLDNGLVGVMPLLQRFFEQILNGSPQDHDPGK